MKTASKRPLKPVYRAVPATRTEAIAKVSAYLARVQRPTAPPSPATVAAWDPYADLAEVYAEQTPQVVEYWVHRN